MKYLAWLIGIVATLATIAFVAVLLTRAAPPAAAAPSRAWLERGPFEVAVAERTFVDQNRTTSANGDFTGAPSRTLVTRFWYPENIARSHPVVIYSHGFMSNREGGAYLARALASRGYVVAAPDYPLTHRNAPGGPLVTDVVNQPADLSFLLDTLFALDSGLPFAGGLDPDRIGVAGISLGGLTATLAAFHARWRDPRIAAAVSIAGPASMFTREYFAHADLPFLMIAGTEDALIDYGANAATIPDRYERGSLVSIAGGSHTGFVDVADPAMRWMSNPDSLGCAAVLASVGQRTDNPLDVLADGQAGIVFDPNAPGVCDREELPETLHPGRQHMITQVAVVSFFEHYFAADADQRERAYRVLAQSLESDFPEARVRMALRD